MSDSGAPPRSSEVLHSERDRDMDRSPRRDMSPRDNGRGRKETIESKTKLYVGNLSSKIDKRDLEDVFERCGPLLSVEIKHGGFAFVEFEDPRDAEDAVRKMRDYELNGCRLMVEFSRSKLGTSGGCFLCGGSGHWARECPDARTRGLDVRSGLCFKCGQAGHLARHCRGGGGGGGGGYHGGRSGDYYGRGRSRSPRGYGRRRSPSPYGGRSGYGGGYGNGNGGGGGGYRGGGGYGSDRRRSPIYNDYRGAPYDDRRH